MPRQLLDAYGHVRPLTVITPIARGGTAADNAPQAVINLQGINRDKIAVPLGIAGADYQGRLMRKYLEGAGIFSGITIEGPNILVKSTPSYTFRPLFFVSNFDTQTPPRITISDAGAMASLVTNWPTFSFATPQTGTSITLTINDREYTFPLVDDGIVTPEILIDDDVTIAGNRILEFTKFATTGISNIDTPAAWYSLPLGKTTINQPLSLQGVLIEGRAGETGNIVVSNGSDVFNLPKSQIRLTLPSSRSGNVNVTLSGEAVAKYALISNQGLTHTGTTVEVARDQAFLDIVFQQVNSAVLYNCLLNLSDGIYYIRVKYHAGAVLSSWSTIKKITIDSALNALNEMGILIDPDLINNAQFGASVDTKQNLVLVGVPGFGDTNMAGCVVMYRREGFTHRYLGRAISANVNSPSERFGTSVSMGSDGDIFVGAPGENAVHVYTFDGNSFLYKETIPARPDSVQFGYAVKVTDVGLFVGDPECAVNGVNAGAVHFFSKVSGNYVYKETLYPTTPGLNDRFGISLSATDDAAHVFIGSTSPNLEDTIVGKFYIFSMVGSAYAESTVRNSPLPGAGYRFARSLDYDATTQKLYVGCEGDNTRGPSSGAVYVFNCNLQAQPVSAAFSDRIMPLHGDTNMCYGSAVSMSDSGYQLYVGSRKYALNAVEDGGVFFLS